MRILSSNRRAEGVARTYLDFEVNIFTAFNEGVSIDGDGELLGEFSHPKRHLLREARTVKVTTGRGRRSTRENFYVNNCWPAGVISRERDELVECACPGLIEAVSNLLELNNAWTKRDVLVGSASCERSGLLPNAIFDVGARIRWVFEIQSKYAAGASYSSDRYGVRVIGYWRDRCDRASGCPRNGC